MARNIAVLLAFVLLVSAFGTACEPTATPSPVKQAQPATATATPKVSVPPLTLVVPTAVPTVVPTKPVATVTAVSDKRIVISEVSFPLGPVPLRVVGKAQVFEATVSLRLKGAAGNVLTRGFTQASMGAPEWGDYAVDVYFLSPAIAEKGTLEIFEVSMKDGSAQTLVSVPVDLKAASDFSSWKPHFNREKGFQVSYPGNWEVNQGAFGPPPPVTTRFSTLKSVESGQGAEIFIAASDKASLAEMRDLDAKGYKKTSAVVGGTLAVRYTDKSPHAGIYDVFYVSVGAKEFRIHLSAATRDFDAVFALLVGSFTLIP